MERLRRKRPTSNRNPGNEMFRASNCSSNEYDELLTFEFGRRPTPMKKLLAKEMSPGVVAKLMGLDSLPPNHGSQRQETATSFKDVYEVPMAPRPRHHCCHVSTHPTRIVVLKPKMDRKDRDVPLVKKREIDRRSVSRELAKEITRQMRLSSSSFSKGYAADEESPISTHSQRLRKSSHESSMSREGKKRISDRWNNLNHRIGNSTASRGSTLAEMLAVSEEKESKHLGISSRDGWKESKLTRSQSLPTSSSKAGEDRFVCLKEKKKSRSRSNSATSFPCPYVITDDTCPKKLNSNSSHVTETSPVDKTSMNDTATTDEPNCPTPLQELRSEDCEESPVAMDQSVQASEAKEGDQPSPVSVLAAPFSDDPSSSPDCFESLSADLQGLRMQLQLLKLESESYEEEHMVLSSDNEDKNEEKSSSLCSNSQKNWEKRYAINALVRSTLDDDDPDSFVASWHSHDFPIGPHVFEALEKQEEEEDRSKCERKLLFDRINEAIVEIHERLLFRPNELQECLIRILSGSEEEAKKEMAEKVQSQWLDVREDVEAIAANLQKSLYDELVGELLLDFAY